jgi:hypothetical protein
MADLYGPPFILRFVRREAAEQAIALVAWTRSEVGQFGVTATATVPNF